MVSSSNGSVHPLGRLDDLASLMLMALLEMAVATTMPSPILRHVTFSACVTAGPLLSPITSFRADLDAAINPLIDRPRDSWPPDGRPCRATLLPRRSQ
jgi:hypothetical protein